MLYGSVGRVGLRALLGTSFSPLSLFANGEQGVWYQNSDFSTLFQDSNGVTPVTALEQPVGLRLDKSRGLVLGSEQIVNGSFSADVSWVKLSGATISGGVAVLDSTSVTQGLTQSHSFALGRTYLVSMTWTGRISAGIGAYGSGDVRFVSSSTAGSFTGYVNLNAGTGASFWVLCPTGNTATIDNISVRELPGNHLSQSTSTARPVLSARVNALTYTEDFSNAAWVKSGLLAFGSGSTANAAVAPNGTTTADLITESTATSRHEVQQAASPVLSGSTAYVFSFYAKEPPANSRRYVQTFSNGTDGTWHANFDLNAGVVSGIGSNGTASITSVGDGWFRCVWNFTSAASPAGSVVYISLLNSGTAARAASYTGDGTSGIYIWGADLRAASESSALPVYQRVGAATYGTSTSVGNPDYDSTGFPPYLIYDGGDWYQTNSIDFTATDKMSVFAGVRKLSDPLQSAIIELSSAWSSNNGAFVVQTVGSNYQFAVRGTGNNGRGYGPYPAPVTDILTGQLRTSAANSAEAVVVNIDAAFNAGTTDSTAVSTGNFGNYPLYIGARAGTSNFYTGRDYGFVIVGRAVTASELTNTEDYMDVQTFGKNMTLVYSDELTTALGELITAADGDQIYMSVSYV